MISFNKDNIVVVLRATESGDKGVGHSRARSNQTLAGKCLMGTTSYIVMVVVRSFSCR